MRRGAIGWPEAQLRKLLQLLEAVPWRPMEVKSGELTEQLRRGPGAALMPSLRGRAACVGRPP